MIENSDLVVIDRKKALEKGIRYETYSQLRDKYYVVDKNGRRHQPAYAGCFPFFVLDHELTLI